MIDTAIDVQNGNYTLTNILHPDNKLPPVDEVYCIFSDGFETLDSASYDSNGKIQHNVGYTPAGDGAVHVHSAGYPCHHWRNRNRRHSVNTVVQTKVFTDPKQRHHNGHQQFIVSGTVINDILWIATGEGREDQRRNQHRNDPKVPTPLQGKVKNWLRDRYKLIDAAVTGGEEARQAEQARQDRAKQARQQR
jgi:hypothetical protein